MINLDHYMNRLAAIERAASGTKATITRPEPLKLEVTSAMRVYTFEVKRVLKGLTTGFELSGTFRSVDPSSKEKPGDLGLGLATPDRIAEFIQKAVEHDEAYALATQLRIQQVA